MDNKRILAINPGSTSTKIAVFDNSKSIFLKNIKHPAEEISKYEKISDQFEFRKDIILQELKDADIDVQSINAIVGRGGLVKPIESGVYEINEALESDLKVGVLGEHASNLGGLIAKDVARSVEGAKAFITDPVVVDEMQDVARISGHPEFERMSIFHALNQKAIVRTFAKSVDKKYEELNVIVAHLGGGVSVGAHRKGRVVDVNNALDGDGPFSPERSGTLPVGALAKLCMSGKYTLDQIKKMITGRGGFVAYLDTNDAYDAEVRMEKGDEKAKSIIDAMSYQVSKSIGEMAAVLKGEVDGILVTGGIAHSKYVIEYIKEHTSFIAPVVAYPGEDEMSALAMNGLMVLNNEVACKEYK